MMKILVFSDSHGEVAGMDRAVSAHRDAEYILHAGDGAGDFRVLRERHSDRAFANVAGNCDFTFFDSADRPPLQCTLDVAGRRIFLTHGHKFYVKSSAQALIEHAEKNDIDIAIFGHTHNPLNLWLPDVGKRGLRLVNPGTVSGSGTGRHTYAIIDIRGGDVLVSIADL